MQIINNLNKDDFILTFTNIFEKSDWIIKELYLQKPFKNFEEIKLKINKIFDLSNKNNQLKVLLKHPDLAYKVKIKSLTKESMTEQMGSGLDKCSESEFNEFKKLNIEYKKKFGFPFILAIFGKNKNEILHIFKLRIQSSKKEEFDEAKEQVKKIANLRLEQLRKNYNHKFI